jgi:hypothetical protein
MHSVSLGVKKIKMRLLTIMISNIKIYKRILFFFIGTGRSGTHFFADLFSEHKDIDSFHTDKHNKHDLDSFSRFAKWFELPISIQNVIDYRGFFISKANKKNKMYLEANAYLSFIIKEFYEKFNAKFVLTVRNPAKVVNSLENKGWYRNIGNYNSIPPYPDYNFFKMNHSFGRISPKNMDELIIWKNYSVVGKNSWFWKSYHEFVFELLNHLPESHKKIIKVEDFNYDEYKIMCKFIDTPIQINKKKFNKIVNNRPEKSKKTRSDKEWIELEKKEFNSLTASIREKLGYDELK